MRFFSSPCSPLDSHLCLKLNTHNKSHIPQPKKNSSRSPPLRTAPQNPTSLPLGPQGEIPGPPPHPLLPPREHLSHPEGAHPLHHRVDPQHPTSLPHRRAAHQVRVRPPRQPPAPCLLRAAGAGAGASAGARPARHHHLPLSPWATGAARRAEVGLEETKKQAGKGWLPARPPASSCKKEKSRLPGARCSSLHPGMAGGGLEGSCTPNIGVATAGGNPQPSITATLGSPGCTWGELGALGLSRGLGGAWGSPT